MKIGIIGYKGLIGSAIYEELRSDNSGYLVYGITECTKFLQSEVEYDILINANGNSRKFWANNHPHEDFIKSVDSVSWYIHNYKYKKYIQISSIDANDNHAYGLHKRLVEMMVSIYCKNYTILRCATVIGKGMKKGIVKDIIDGYPVFLTKDSLLQIITNTGIAKAVRHILTQKENDLYNVGGTHAISVKELGIVLGKMVYYSNKLRTETYSYCMGFNSEFKFKTSKEYVKEYMMYERME